MRGGGEAGARRGGSAAGDRAAEARRARARRRARGCGGVGERGGRGDERGRRRRGLTRLGPRSVGELLDPVAARRQPWRPCRCAVDVAAASQSWPCARSRTSARPTTEPSGGVDSGEARAGDHLVREAITEARVAVAGRAMPAAEARAPPEMAKPPWSAEACGAAVDLCEGFAHVEWRRPNGGGRAAGGAAGGGPR